MSTYVLGTMNMSIVFLTNVFCLTLGSTKDWLLPSSRFLALIVFFEIVSPFTEEMLAYPSFLSPNVLKVVTTNQWAQSLPSE